MVAERRVEKDLSHMRQGRWPDFVEELRHFAEIERTAAEIFRRGAKVTRSRKIAERRERLAEEAEVNALHARSRVELLEHELSSQTESR